MASKKTTSLGDTLAEFDVAVKTADKAVAKSLRPGVNAAALAKLEKVVGKLDADLRTWFQWHDGQNGTPSVGPSANHYLLPAKNVADAWRFLDGEGLRPWKPTWLPLMANGGGDYVVYDRAGGQLLTYYHDDKRRPKVAASLAAWAKDVAEAWRRVVDGAKVTGAPEGWSRVESPAKAVVAKKPAGTAYFYRSTSNIGKGIYFHLFWKRAKNEWFQAINSKLEGAWTSISNNLLPFQAFPDGGIANHVAEEDVFKDGADALHAGLYERHFDAPPFPVKK